MDETVIVVECKGCGSTVICHGSQLAKCEYCNRPVSASSIEKSDAAEKVAGISTSSAAKVYIDFFFDNFDWDEFAKSPNFTIEEIDILLENIKKSAGDKPETWSMCFDYLYLCADKKVDSINKSLDDIVHGFVLKKNHNTLYNDFELLKENFDKLKTSTPQLVLKLDSYINFAQNCQIDSAKIKQMRSQKDLLDAKLASLNLPQNLNDLSKIKDALEQLHQSMLLTFKEKGIDAEADYAKGIKLYNDGDYKNALLSFMNIKDFRKSSQYIEAINNVMQIGDFMVVGGGESLFYSPKKQSQSYRIVNGLIYKEKSFMTKGQIDYIFANDIYCINNSQLKCYENVTDLSFIKNKKSKGLPYTTYNLYGQITAGALEKQSSKIDGFIILVQTTRLNFKQKKQFFSSNQKLITNKAAKPTAATDSGNFYDLWYFSPSIKKFTLLQQNIYEFVERKSDTYYFIAPIKQQGKSNVEHKQSALYSINAVTGEEKFLLSGRAIIRTILDDGSIIFTRSHQGEDNISIYSKPNLESAEEQTLAQNVYRYYDFVDDKIFYVVGNKDIKTLYSIHKDSKEPVEVMRYMQDILFNDEQYIYTMRGTDIYTIYRIPITGGKEQRVVFGVKSLVQIEANTNSEKFIIKGKLYYMDYYGMLCSVRLNGTGGERLVPGFNHILGVKQDRIYYYALDNMADKIYSFYSMESDGSKRIKHAYNIDDAADFDADSIYFTLKLKGDERLLYRGLEDKIMQKKLDKILAKLEKRKVDLTVSCEAIKLFNTLSQKDCDCGYVWNYPTKQYLKVLKRKR